MHQKVSALVSISRLANWKYSIFQPRNLEQLGEPQSSHLSSHSVVFRIAIQREMALSQITQRRPGQVCDFLGKNSFTPPGATRNLEKRIVLLIVNLQFSKFSENGINDLHLHISESVFWQFGETSFNLSWPRPIPRKKREIVN